MSSSWIHARDGCEGGGHPIRSDVKILFTAFDLFRPVTRTLSQNPNRIEEIGQSEDHEEEAVLHHIPADSWHNSPELSRMGGRILVEYWL
jgi:hypothetical protein